MENLENAKGRSKIEKEILGKMYYQSLKKALKKHDNDETMEYTPEMDEEALEEIDEVIEPHLEETRPDLIIKRIHKLEFLVLNRDEFEKKFGNDSEEPK